MSKQTEVIETEKRVKAHLKPLSVYLLHWAGIILGVWWIPTPTFFTGTKGLVCFTAYVALSVALFVCNSLFFRRQTRSLLIILATIGLTFFILNYSLNIELKYFSGMILLDAFSFIGTFSSLVVVALSVYIYFNYNQIFREDNPTITSYFQLKEWGAALVFAAILAIIIRTFVIQAFKIPSGSMENTLLIGDHLMVAKPIYGTRLPLTNITILPVRDPERGDIIVFEYPGDKELPFAQRKDYIKRVIGLPNDRVKMIDQIVYVNSEPFVIDQEVHKGSQNLGSLINNFPEVQVPDGHYFVLGDNRDRSADSRYWGFVPKENIKGKAFIKYISWDSDKNEVRWNRIGGLID